jgi:hypothetical protein
MRAADERPRYRTDHLQRHGGRDRDRRCVLQRPRLRRMAGPSPQADLDRRPYHPRQDIEAWQSLPACSVRAGGMGRQHIAVQPLLGGLDPGLEPVALPALGLDQHDPVRATSALPLITDIRWCAVLKRARATGITGNGHFVAAKGYRRSKLKFPRAQWNVEGVLKPLHLIRPLVSGQCPVWDSALPPCCVRFTSKSGHSLARSREIYFTVGPSG